MEEEVSYPRDCECGKLALTDEYRYTLHVESKGHETAMEKLGFVQDEEGGYAELPEDLKTIIKGVDGEGVEIPILVRSKMLRHAFSARDWPNSKHPGTVRDFMITHDIPIFDVAHGQFNQMQADQKRTEQIKEYARAQH